jgi:hypothetical protein
VFGIRAIHGTGRTFENWRQPVKPVAFFRAESIVEKTFPMMIAG